LKAKALKNLICSAVPSGTAETQTPRGHVEKMYRPRQDETICLIKNKRQKKRETPFAFCLL
jgi:hypothetical protein